MEQSSKYLLQYHVCEWLLIFMCYLFLSLKKQWAPSLTLWFVSDLLIFTPRWKKRHSSTSDCNGLWKHAPGDSLPSIKYSNCFSHCIYWPSYHASSVALQNHKDHRKYISTLKHDFVKNGTKEFHACCLLSYLPHLQLQRDGFPSAQCHIVIHTW